MQLIEVENSSFVQILGVNTCSIMGRSFTAKTGILAGFKILGNANILRLTSQVGLNTLVECLGDRYFFKGKGNIEEEELIKIV